MIDRLETIVRVAAAYRTPSLQLRPAERKPGDTWGSLRIVAKIGEGAFGHVYRAWDARLDREVALKLVDDVAQAEVVPDAVEEGRLLARVHHPNVVTVFGADRIDGSVGIWMELVKGATLEQELTERGPFDARHVAAIGRDVCQALAAVHDAGLLHRDIKAQNVIREAGGRIVLMDFGTGREPSGSGSGQSGAVGTPLYVAPELFNGASCSVATEIYSVGVLLFHLATGEYPITGQTVSEIREAHARHAKSAASATGRPLPQRLSRVLARALAADPNDRYRDVRQLAWALEAVWRDSQRLRRTAGWLAIGVVVMAASLAALTSVSSTAKARTAVLKLPLPVDGDKVRGMALSPDGHRLAYIARANGRDELVVRSLDQFSAVPIYSAAGLRQPFFSPDGRWVGVSEGTNSLQAKALIKVSAGGGDATRLCEPGAAFGARWLPDGTIVFAARGELWKVPEVGGTPVRLLASRLQIGESLAEPDALGNGTLLATNWRRGQPDRLVLVSPAGAITPLEDDASNGRYSPSGHILFVRNQSIMARPIDARGEFTGPAVPVSEAGFATDFEISATGALVYRTVPRGAETGLGVMWAIRGSNVTMPVSFPIDDYRPFAWQLSPDDSKVFVALPHLRDSPHIGKQHSSIWIGDLRRGVLSQLTFEDTIPIAWGADSRSVTIKTADGGLARRHIDGSGKDDALASARDVIFGNRGTWSSDGRALVLQGGGGVTGTSTDLRAVVFSSTDAIGREAPALSMFANSRFNEFSPAFSPDGKWVAYQSDDSGRDEIYVRPFPGPGPQIQISRDGGTTPKWKGHEIFYVQAGDSGKLIMAATIASQPELRVTETRVALRSVDFERFDVTSDGRRFLLLAGTRHSPRQLNLILNWPTQLGITRDR